MNSRNWPILEMRRNHYDLAMYTRILDGSASLDRHKFVPADALYNTRHGAVQGNINTNVKRFAFHVRMLRRVGVIP